MERIRTAMAYGLRAELNRIFIEPPKWNHNDAGWFCREHALHVGAVAEMLGEPAEICCGDVVLVLPEDSFSLCMVESGADHVWCKVGRRAPIDASFTLRHFDVSHPDVAYVCPEHPEALSGMELRYTHRLAYDNLARTLKSNRAVVHYNERQSRRPDYRQLLAHPYELLHVPVNAPSLIDTHGSEVFFALTAHLFRMVTGVVAPIDTKLPWNEALRLAIAQNPDARQFVLQRLPA